MSGKESKKAGARERQKPDVSRLAGALPTRVPRVKQSAEVVEERAKPPNYRALIYCGFAIAVLVLFAFANTMTFGLVFNDFLNYQLAARVITGSHYLTQLISRGITLPTGQELVNLTYALDLLSAGPSPAYAHGVNICLHVLSCLLFSLFTFRLARQLQLQHRVKLDPYFIATAAGSLLAVHPLVSGSVAFISGRAALLAACFYFASLNLFLSGMLTANLAITVLAYSAALLCSFLGIEAAQQAATAPFLIALLVPLLKPPGITLRDWLSDRWYEVALFVAVGVFFLSLFAFGDQTIIDTGFGLPKLAPLTYIATQCKAIVTYYLRCLIVPVGLSVDPPYVLATGPVDVLSLAGLTLISGAAWAAFKWRAQPLVLFGSALSLLGLFPWLVRTQPEVVADGRFYLPLAGVAVLFGMGIASLATLSLKRAVAIFSAVIVALTVLSNWRNLAWRDNVHLWWQAIKLNQSSARAHGEMSLALLSNEKRDDAKKQADEALKLDPQSLDAHLALGSYYLLKRDFEKAKNHWNEALEMEQKRNFTQDQLAQLKSRLATVYFELNDVKKAGMLAQAGKEIYEDDPMIHLILGSSYVANHQPLLAVNELQQGMRLDRHNSLFYEPMATALLDTKRPEMVKVACQMLAKAAGNRDPHIQLLYARSQLCQGNAEEAWRCLRGLRDLLPHDADVAYLLSVAERMKGNAQESDKLKQEALALDREVELRNAVTDMKRASEASPTRPPAPARGASSSAGSASQPPKKSK